MTIWGSDISGESMISIVSDEASMMGHWVALKNGERLLSLRGGNEGKHLSERVQRTFNNAAHFWMLKSIYLWIPNEMPKPDARKSYKTAFVI